jgi:porin
MATSRKTWNGDVAANPASQDSRVIGMRWVSYALAAAVALLGTTARGQTGPSQGSEAPATAPAKEAALPPAPDYSGDIWTRSTLTGDWGGTRNDLAKKGLTIDLYSTNVYQGVLTGGNDKGWQFGGRENLTLSLDMGRMGLMPGGYLTLEGEGNYGEFVGAPQTGAILPADNNQLFPGTNGPQFDLSSVMYMQFVSHNLGFFVGKIDATSGDANAFAHSKGERQFLNTAFGFNPIISVAAPAYALGAGMVIVPTGNPHEFIITASVMDMEGQASTAGFDTAFKGGTSFTAEGRYTTHFFGLTGHQLLGGMYSDRRYTSLDQNLRNFIIPGLPIQQASGSWAGYYNFDQYVYQPDPKSDMGLGIFGRFGISDGEANPIKYSASVGLSGKGLIPGRKNDQFGIGYFRLCRADSPVLDTLGFRESQGLETYYEIAITPCIFLTPDFQVIEPSQKHVDTSCVLGLRLTVKF